MKTIVPEASFTNDLGADSLDTVDGNGIWKRVRYTNSRSSREHSLCRSSYWVYRKIKIKI